MKFAHLVWGNLKRKKLRTILTLMSILVAFMLFGMLCAIKEALTGGISPQGVDRLMVMNRVGLLQMLPESYKARMERVPGVKLATFLTWFGGYYKEEKNLMFECPVIPDEILAMNTEFLLPPDQLAAWKKTRTAAIIGRKSAEKFGFKIGDKIPIQSPIWAKKDGSHTWEFDIAGIYDGKEKGTDTTGIFFHYAYFDEARANSKGQVGWYMVKVNDPKKSAEIAKLIDREFENSSAETKAEPEGVMAQEWANQVGDIALIATSILGAVFFTILLVVGNTMAQAVRERTGELGVLKAIGFTNTQVMVMVLAESCLLAVMGGLLGLGLAMAATAGGDPTHGMLPMFYLPRRDLITGLELSLVLGLVTGIFPAMQAMRLQVATALRRM